MAMRIEILEPDARFRGVVRVSAPGVYGSKGRPLPRRMALLVAPAAAALARAVEQIVAEGGHLYISDMFRSAAEQQRAHEDWKTGRKPDFSPPSCQSVHEAGRAIDIDAFDTGIGHARVRQILNAHGWTHIVETLTGSECWHYEFRGPLWEEYRVQHGYPAMARAMKEEIGNLVGRAQADRRAEEVRSLQLSLAAALGTELVADGLYGPATREAVAEFQRRQGLQVDGVAGPITRARLAEVASLPPGLPGARLAAAHTLAAPAGA